MAILLKTSKGALCRHTGGLGGRGASRADGKLLWINGKFIQPTYIQVQMLPAHPQRFEWVREDRLIEVESREQTG